MQGAGSVQECHKRVGQRSHPRLHGSQGGGCDVGEERDVPPHDHSLAPAGVARDWSGVDHDHDHDHDDDHDDYRTRMTH